MRNGQSGVSPPSKYPAYRHPQLVFFFLTFAFLRTPSIFRPPTLRRELLISLISRFGEKHSILDFKMAQREEFLPACPIPLVIQPHERIAVLKDFLNDPKNERQKTNILGLIRMYETGELGPLQPGNAIYICEGMIMDKPPSPENLPPNGSAVWSEVSLHILPPLYFRISLTFPLGNCDADDAAELYPGNYFQTVICYGSLGLTTIIAGSISNGTVLLLWFSCWECNARGML